MERSDLIVDRPADLQPALNAVAEDPDALIVAVGADLVRVPVRTEDILSAITADQEALR